MFDELFLDNKKFNYFYSKTAVPQLVEELRYKSEGRGFDSQCCQRNFSLMKSFWPHYGFGVDPVSKTTEYQKVFPGAKVAGA